MKFFKYFLYAILYAVLGVSGIIFFKEYVNKSTVISTNSDFKMMPLSQEWEVLKIHDGDTIRASRGNQVESFRLCGIDAPELAQSLGKNSRDFLISLVYPENEISISIVDTDRYGRKVAEIFILNDDDTEKFLNEELVRVGLAYHYARYSDNCPNKIAIENAEAIAKSNQVGVWGGNYTTPWDYRRLKRNKTGFTQQIFVIATETQCREAIPGFLRLRRCPS